MFEGFCQWFQEVDLESREEVVGGRVESSGSGEMDVVRREKEEGEEG